MGPFWGPKSVHLGAWMAFGASGSHVGVKEGSKNPLGEPLGGLQGPPRAETSCEEGPLIVLEVRYDLVLTKRGPQEGPKRAPREAQNDSWTGTPQKPNTLKTPMAFE